MRSLATRALPTTSMLRIVSPSASSDGVFGSSGIFSSAAVEADVDADAEVEADADAASASNPATEPAPTADADADADPDPDAEAAPPAPPTCARTSGVDSRASRSVKT